MAGPKEVALDVIEFEPTPAGVEVQEKQFDSQAELWRYMAHETGRGP
jgi:hypothetical protein